MECEIVLNKSKNPSTQSISGGTIQHSPSGWKDRAWLFLDAAGPGLITGAADDDPSGIGTYSVAGAQLGTSILWLAIFTWPLMAGVQMMCARIGMVTGEGLAAALRKKIPRPALIAVCGSLFIANTLNVGADLSAMADAAAMLTGFSSQLFIWLFAIGISWATIRLCYSDIARVLKWLALFLFSYIATAVLMKPDWPRVAHDMFIPHLPRERAAWATIVAILGTTISPYLFFWQSSQEVEEEKALGRKTISARRGATRNEILSRKIDVGIGTFFSNLVMFFIVLATALTLHAHGLTNIETSQQAAKALEPLAGRWATWLYSVGLIGTGLLAIPTLTGSAAYALAETFRWKQGLDAKLHQARDFYYVIIASTTFAVLIDFSGVNPVKALYYSAIVNGLLAPFLLLGVLYVACDRKLMRNQPSTPLTRTVVALTTILMFAAAVGMFFL